MASFTDAIPQFNPYIQQLPVEAMVAVGMEKQQRYDQGLQKIQSQIDQVAGLDVVRDIDKQYLQSKLNELGSKLKTVAAGDFSNYQLVNSVAGMASSVVKDNNVLSSVQATAQYRKEQKFMEESRQKGESSIQNEYDFSRQTNNWLNDSNVGAGFSGRYRKYIDVDKKWLDVMKSLHSDLLEEDMPYVTNLDGSINYGETAQAMQRMSKEGVSAEKIQNALRSSLSPDELEQLNINGRYQFRNINDPAQLATLATSRTASAIAQNTKTIEDLQGALKLYESDPDKYTKAEQGIKSLQEVNQRLTTQMNEEIEFIKANPEEAKGLIYKNGAIEQFANSYAWENQKNNLLTNPIRQDDWEAKNYGLAQARLQQTRDEFAWNQFMDQENYKLKVDEANAKMFGVPGGFQVYGGKSTSVPNQRVALFKDIDAASSIVETQVNELVNALNAGGGTKVKKIQVLNALDAYAKGYTTAYDYLIPNDLKDLGNSILSAKSDLNRKQQFLKTTEQEVANSPEIQELKNQYNTQLEDIGALTVTIKGREMNFTPFEIAQYLSKVQETVTGGQMSGTGATGGQKIETKILSPLTEREKLIYDNKGMLRGYLDTYKRAGSNYNNQYNSLVEKKISDKTIQYVPRELPIIFGSGEGNIARNTWENISTSLLRKVVESSLSGMEGGYEGLSASRAREALLWFDSSDKSNLQYKKLEQGDQTSLIILKGDEEIIIPLDPREAQQLPIIDRDSPSPQLRRLMEAQAMGGRNTNPSGSFENSYFQGQFMPRVKINARADMKQAFGTPEKQYITIRSKLPDGTVYPLQLDEAVDATAGMNFIGNLTDEKVKQLYLQSPKISEEVKRIIRTM
jgi:Ca2+-binding EF-hand superfamily protein